MKTHNEISRMINHLFDARERSHDKEYREAICDTIDALLWVIDDASGYDIEERFGYKER